MFGYFRLTLWIPYTRFLMTSQPFAPTRYTAKVFGSTVALEEQFSLRCCAGVGVMGPPEMRRRGSRPTKCNSFIPFPVENTLRLRYILRSAAQIPTLKESRVSWWFHNFHRFLNLEFTLSQASLARGKVGTESEPGMEGNKLPHLQWHQWTRERERERKL